MGGDERAEDGVDLVLDGLGVTGARHMREPEAERRLDLRKTSQHKSSQTAELAGAIVAPATLILDDAIEMKEAHGGRVRMHFDLEPAGLPRDHVGAVAKARRFQEAAKRHDIGGERTAEVRRVTAGVETAEVTIQLLFGGTDAGLIANDEGSVHRDPGTAASGLGLNPVEDVALPLEAGDAAQMQPGSVERERGHAAGFSIPTQIDAEKCLASCVGAKVSHSSNSLTGSPS